MLIDGVTVSGRNMMLGNLLIARVESRMAALSEKYFGRLITCRVVFSKGRKGIKFGCSAQVIVGRDLHFFSEAHMNTVMGSFNEAYERLAKQLRRAKRELHEDKPHRHRKAQAFDRLTLPDPAVQNGFSLPVDGDQLSISDVEPDTGANVVQALYGCLD
jgi:ribosomal subunit interface protein